MTSVAGVIVAGGKSSRFGRNKALEPFEGEPLIVRAVRTLGRWCTPLMVVCNHIEEYVGIEAVLIGDLVPHQGPLMALYTALLFSPHEWIFFRAVDMPFLEPPFISLLMDQTVEGRADVVVPVHEGRLEPLCALYRRRCLRAVAHAVEEGGRRMVHFYPQVRVNRIEEEVWRKADPTGRSLVNINTQEELQRIGGGGVV